MVTVRMESIQSLMIAPAHGDQILSTATGFVAVAPGGPVLVTNRHVLTGRHNHTGKPLSDTAGIPDKLVIIHREVDDPASWIEVWEDIYDAGAPRWKEHPTLGAIADMAALPLAKLRGVGLHPFDLANPGPPIVVAPAEAVSVIGYPFSQTGGGQFPIWATGFIATEPDIDYDELPTFLIDCRSRPGQSGSPVVAARSSGGTTHQGGATMFHIGPISRLLGMYSGRINAESDLGVVWKLAAIKELVDSIQ